MIFDATVPSQRYRYKKKHFARFDFFVKKKLVSTVWVSTSLSKSGYPQGRQRTRMCMMGTMYSPIVAFYLCSCRFWKVECQKHLGILSWSLSRQLWPKLIHSFQDIQIGESKCWSCLTFSFEPGIYKIVRAILSPFIVGDDRFQNRTKSF